jgi:hypothetical protein
MTRWRLATIAGGFMLGLAVAVGMAAWLAWEPASAVGVERYQHRALLPIWFRPRDRTGPLVVWVGDSTIAPIARRSYPHLLAPELARRGVESRVVASLGLDFFDFYLLMGRVLDLAPDVVVMVAHLRLFDAGTVDVEAQQAGWRSTFNDFASEVPIAELPRLATLPLAARGLSIPRVLLAHLLHVEGAEDWLRFVDGLHAIVSRERHWGRAPGETKVQPKGDIRSWLRRDARSYVVDIGPRHPTVRMMRATVEMVRRRGARALVIGSPIPLAGIQNALGIRPEEFQPRFAVLREAVEQAGGEFLDLHDALPQAEFADAVGHFNDVGAAHMTRLVRPALERLLPATSPPGTRVSSPPATPR